jgi:hypothetical protein
MGDLLWYNAATRSKQEEHMNKSTEELFIKYLKNKVKFYKEMQAISIDIDEHDQGIISATDEILSHFLLLVKTEVEPSSADLDMRDHYYGTPVDRNKND